MRSFWLGLPLLLWGCSASPPPASPSPVPSAVVVSPTPRDPIVGGDPGLHTDRLPPADKSSGVTLTAGHKGEPNKALHFEGQGSHLDVDIDINPGLMPQLTITGWARWTGEGEGTYQVFSHDNGDYDRSLGLDTRSPKGWGWSAFAGDQGVLGSFPVKKDEWVMFTAVYDQPNATTTLYINDQVLEAHDSHLGPGLEKLTLGANPTYGENFVGDIEGVRVLARAWTRAEVEAAYKDR